MKLSPRAEAEIREMDEYDAETGVYFIVPTSDELFRHWLVNVARFNQDEYLGSHEAPWLRDMLAEIGGYPLDWAACIEAFPYVIGERGNQLFLAWNLELVTPSIDVEGAQEIRTTFPCILANTLPLDGARCRVQMKCMLPFFLPSFIRVLTAIADDWPSVSEHKDFRRFMALHGAQGGDDGSGQAAQRRAGRPRDPWNQKAIDRLLGGDDAEAVKNDWCIDYEAGTGQHPSQTEDGEEKTWRKRVWEPYLRAKGAK